MDLKRHKAGIGRGCHQHETLVYGTIVGETTDLAEYEQAWTIAQHVKGVMAKNVVSRYVRVESQRRDLEENRDEEDGQAVSYTIRVSTVNIPNSRSQRANIRRDNKTLKTFAKAFNSPRVQAEAFYKTEDIDFGHKVIDQ